MKFISVTHYDNGVFKLTLLHVDKIVRLEREPNVQHINARIYLEGGERLRVKELYEDLVKELRGELE